MKAHFIGDLRGSRTDYQQIVKIIRSKGFDIVTEHSLSRSIDDVRKEGPKDAEKYGKKMISWIKSADVIVVEITLPGLGAGYELATALELGRPVIALYKPEGDNTPFILKALEGNDKLQAISYKNSTLEIDLSTALDFASESADTRFNFFISPKHQNYLDWISKTRKIPRAVFLRRLIEIAMKNEDFS